MEPRVTDAERTRTVTWQDPLRSASAARELGGLEHLRAMVRGEVPPPPIAELMGFTLDSVEVGRVAFAVKPGEHHYNPIGVVHGGLSATLLDSALGCAIYSTLPPGVAWTTVELHVNFVRAITADTGRLVCTASVLHGGSRVATAEGKLTDEKGVLYAHGTTTCLILRPKGA